MTLFQTFKTQPNPTLRSLGAKCGIKQISPAEIQVCCLELHVWNVPQRQWHNQFVKTTYAAFIATRRIFSPHSSYDIVMPDTLSRHQQPWQKFKKLLKITISSNKKRSNMTVDLHCHKNKKKQHLWSGQLKICPKPVGKAAKPKYLLILKVKNSKCQKNQ